MEEGFLRMVAVCDALSSGSPNKDTVEAGRLDCSILRYCRLRSELRGMVDDRWSKSDWLLLWRRRLWRETESASPPWSEIDS